MNRILVWFRNDLRLHDHPALFHAAKKGTIIPVFIISPQQTVKGAFFWWQIEALKILEKQFIEHHIQFIVRKGEIVDELLKLQAETKAAAVYWNEQYDKQSMDIERKLTEHLLHRQVEARAFTGQVLLKPGTVLTESNEPYKVFTPFWNKLRQQMIPKPLLKPETMQGGTTLQSIDLQKDVLQERWSRKFHRFWTVGEQASIDTWNEFRHNGLQQYDVKRDFPALQNTSHLSPYIASGNMSIRALWHAVKREGEENPAVSVEPFLRQLAWNEFATHQLQAYPHIENKSMRPHFESFPWRDDKQAFVKWTKGETGYPLVDAGMRELWETGVMHNRVRMVAASFLVKHLMLPWQLGAKWFQETLVDYDCANNTLGWQWVAGSGFDAAPYFRIFNPITQSEKFDAKGVYVQQWVKELEQVSAPAIHTPWKTISDINYPEPIVDHQSARERALTAFQVVKAILEKG